MNQYGVWIDLRVAIIVLVKKQQADIVTKIESEISMGNIRGGSRSSTPYGPQDAVSESKLLEKKKHELRHYYAQVEKALKDPRTVLIAGPSGVKHELRVHLGKAHRFKDVLLETQIADSMTDNQVRALFRDHFAMKS
ncbi:MAG: hypothetical protein RIM99_00720 [Cyclobacteriaceae bacterium]